MVDPNILEKIKIAIDPLTGEGSFQLESVAYGEHYPSCVVQIQSDDFAIIFDGWVLPDHPGTYCFFYSLRLKKCFKAIDVFHSMNIEVLFGKHIPIWDLAKNKNVMVTGVDSLNFYLDLERLCREIHSHWSEIHAFLDKINPQLPMIPPVPKCPYPLNWNMRLMDSKSLPERAFPDIKDLSDAMNPLDRLSKGATITLHVWDGGVDITSYYHNMCRILFHTNTDATTSMFLIFNPSGYAWKKYPDIQSEGKRIVFSLPNVFRVLNIDYSYSPNGVLGDFQIYCQLLADNADAIKDAFSIRNVDISYSKLKNMSGNNQDEINEIIENLNDLIE